MKTCDRCGKRIHPEEPAVWADVEADPITWMCIPCLDALYLKPKDGFDVDESNER